MCIFLTCYSFVIFIYYPFYLAFIHRTSSRDDRKHGERGAKGPRPGLDTRAAAVRTKPLYTGRLLDQLSEAAYKSIPLNVKTPVSSLLTLDKERQQQFS